MALQKTIPAPTGADISYWRVINAQADYRANVGGITLGGYLSHDTRAEGKDIAASRFYEVGNEQFASIFSGAADARARSYDYIKTQPEFTDAEDA